MDREKIARELVRVAGMLVAVDEKKLDKFRRAKNRKPVAKLSFELTDSLGNRKTYIMFFYYEETMSGDRFYAKERLVGSNRTPHSLSSVQARGKSFHTTEDVTFTGDAGEEMIELWYSGNARKFVFRILDEMLASSVLDVRNWLKTGVYQVGRGSPELL